MGNCLDSSKTTSTLQQPYPSGEQQPGCCEDDFQSVSTLQQPAPSEEQQPGLCEDDVRSASILQQPSTSAKQQLTIEECIKLFNEEKDKWDIDALISGSYDLLNATLNSQQKQPQKPSTSATSSTPKLSMLSLIQSGDKFLKFVNEHIVFEDIEKTASKDNVLGAEVTKILSDILQQLGNIHWIFCGLSIVVYLLSKFRKVSENKAECLELLKCMVDLANQIKKLNIHMPEEEKRLKDALLLIVEGCIMCASQIQSGKFFRFLKTSVNSEMLKGLCSKINNPAWAESKYDDVFLSHSGKQKNFVCQLHEELTREGVSCFFDASHQSLPLAVKGHPCIFEAAKKCRVAVLLLSKDFIHSQWPMLELSAFLKAKKSRENSNLRILPLFYKISPDDLTDPSYTQDIPDRKRLEISEETQIEWRNALREVCKFNGLRFMEGENKVCFMAEIINEIHDLLSQSGSDGLATPVGLEEPVKQITEMLELRKTKELAKALVIYGLEGIGKTTLANAVVASLKLEDFNFTKIIIDEDLYQNDFTLMQQQLLKDVFPKYQQGIKINLRHCEEGRDRLTQAFKSEPNKPVFIFIDNALLKDLKKLLPEDLGSLPQGSRILVTARELCVKDLFSERGLPVRYYQVSTLADEHAEKILCCPDLVKLEQIKGDKKNILQICGGIPLILKIVGAQLKKKKYKADNCREILRSLQEGEEIKQENLTERLVNFVYNRLKTSAQEAFLDICTFFYVKDFTRRHIEYVVGVTEVATLENAALITAVPFTNSFDDIRGRGVYWEGEEKLIVHDVIRAKGESMAKGTRIVDDADSLYRAVEDQVVLQSIKGVKIPYNDESEYMLEESLLSCMSNSLRAAFILGPRVSVRGWSINMFEELRYLQLSGDIPCLPVRLEALPRLAMYVGPIFKEGFNINKLPKSLRCLVALSPANRDKCETSESSKTIQTVQNSSLQELSLSDLKNIRILLEGIHQFIELKILSVSRWDEMEELPAQVCQLRSLNKLIMSGWKSLKRLPESFSNLTGLTHLDLLDCPRLEGLCSSFGELRGLRYLSLRFCHTLTELPDSFGQLIALEYLDLYGCIALTKLPDNFVQLTALQYLNLSYCYELKRLPSNFVQLTSLQVVELYGYRGEELSLSLEELKSKFRGYTFV